MVCEAFYIETGNYSVSDVEKLIPFLSLLEQKRTTEFFCEKASVNYIVSHALLRKRLSLYTTMAYELNLNFWRYSKPYLTCGIHFSISHTDNCAAVVISDESLCGIDVESSSATRKSEILFRHALSKSEQKHALLSSCTSKHVIESWVAKEAYLKMLGTGLHIDANEIETSRSIKEMPNGVVKVKNGYLSRTEYSGGVIAVCSQSYQDIVVNEISLDWMLASNKNEVLYHA